jgi:sec-independent protein translocase protein TatB
MFGIGFFELLVIFCAIIIFVGPERLPKAAVEVAKFVRSCRNLMMDVRNHVTERDFSDRTSNKTS